MNANEVPVFKEIASEMRGIRVAKEDRWKLENLAVAIEAMCLSGKTATPSQRFLIGGRFGEKIDQMPVYEGVRVMPEFVKQMKQPRAHRATAKGSLMTTEPTETPAVTRPEDPGRTQSMLLDIMEHIESNPETKSTPSAIALFRYHDHSHAARTFLLKMVREQKLDPDAYIRRVKFVWRPDDLREEDRNTPVFVDHSISEAPKGRPKQWQSHDVSALILFKDVRGWDETNGTDAPEDDA